MKYLKRYNEISIYESIDPINIEQQLKFIEQDFLKRTEGAPSDEDCGFTYSFELTGDKGIVEMGYSSFEDGDCLTLNISFSDLTINVVEGGHHPSEGDYNKDETKKFETIEALIQFVRKTSEEF